MKVEFQLYKDNQIYDERVLYDFEKYVLKFELVSEQLTEYIKVNYSSVLILLHHNLYELQFKNFVGWVNILGASYQLQSRKWNDSQVQQLWLTISQRMAALPFHHFTEAKQQTETSFKDQQQIKYHQWVFLRDQIFSINNELINSWELILREPYSQIIVEKTWNDPWLASNMNENSFIEMMTIGNITKLSEENPLTKTAIANQLNWFFPTRIKETTKKNNLDTRENRWIKWLLFELLELTHWMDGYIKEANTKRVIHRISHLIEDNLQLQIVLKQMLSVPWISEVGRFNGALGNSTVLQRKHGYRQWFEFYQRLNQGICYPIDTAQLKDMIETKKISSLFEYWCFFEVMDAIEHVFQTSKHSIQFTPMTYAGIALKEGIRTNYLIHGRLLMVYYNKTFSRKKESYSIELRPDISIHWDGNWFHLDAKFKNTLEADFLKDDIGKMHIYRDAIQDTKAAIALYPVIEGEQAGIFFAVDGSNLNSGVGAISLDIMNENRKLREWIKNVLTFKEESED